MVQDHPRGTLSRMGSLRMNLSPNASPHENAGTEYPKYPEPQEDEAAQSSANSSQTDVTLEDPKGTCPKRTRRSWSVFRGVWHKSNQQNGPGKQNNLNDGEEWIKGVVFAMRWATLVLIVNIILAVIAIALGYSGSSSRNDHSTVSTSIYDGKCSVSGGWASGLHALINILSTVLLAASNYAMQSMSAPSREDIEIAHAKGQWLDIGTFSYRNIFAMDKRRKLTWLVLLLTSVPIHLMYNSVVFSSMATNLYGIVLIPNDLTKDEMIFDTSHTAEKINKTFGYSAQDLQAEIFNGTLKTLTLEECVDAYAVEYNTHRTTVVVVADREYFNNHSSLEAYYGFSSQDYYAYNSYRYSWMCAQERPTNCTKEDVMGLVDHGKWSVWAKHWDYRNWTFHDPSPGRARYNFSCDYSVLANFAEEENTPLRTDLETLCSHIAAYNPDYKQLSRYFKSPSHWQNSSWASEISFSWGNYTDSITAFRDPVFPPMLDIPVSHCMSKESEERCQLLFSWPICLVVIMCNMIKIIAIYLAANTRRKKIFLTVGDAISSFLTSPDPTTKYLNHPTASNYGFEPARLTKKSYFNTFISLVSSKQHGHHSTDPATPMEMASAAISRKGLWPTKYYTPRRWYQAASPWRWTILFFIIVSSFIVSIVLFCIGSGQRYQNKVTLQTSWETGFGKPSSVAMIGQAAQSVMQVVLLSNMPQLVLSILYFLSNGIMTNMVVAAEYNDYAICRKPLRVSWPKGQQRSTRYLSLPYRYRVPFMGFAVALHWLMSQSLFFTQVRLFDIDGKVVERWSTTRCGYSLVAILTTLIVGAIAAVSLVGLGLRRYKSSMPLPIYSSVGISAACHPPPDDQDAALKPVMWGVPADAEYFGHYTFTAKGVY